MSNCTNLAYVAIFNTVKVEPIWMLMNYCNYLHTRIISSDSQVKENKLSLCNFISIKSVFANGIVSKNFSSKNEWLKNIFYVNINQVSQFKLIFFPFHRFDWILGFKIEDLFTEKTSEVEICFRLIERREINAAF